MVLPKSTVHVSRLAGTALKSFTHGYAQTVVAASQSSYASQNTPVAPLASNFLSRFQDKSGKVLGQHAHFSSVASSQANADNGAPKQDQHDASLAHFHEAWQKHQKSEAKDWQHFQLAKRIGWKPPTTIPEPQNVTEEVLEVDASVPLADEPTNLKRSYSTSAVDNFAKAIDNVEAEAIAIAQVNEAIAEEVAKNKKGSPAPVHNTAESPRLANTSEQAAKVLEQSSSAFEYHSVRLSHLLQDGQYAQIPSAFESMLRDGVKQPSQKAYQALLASALQLTENKHQRAPRVLDIYADMVRRRVDPDAETLTIIIDTLAVRALDAVETSTSLAAKHARLGAGAAIFPLEHLEFKVMAEDQTLNIALKFIDTAPFSLALSGATYESLIKACAARGQVAEMIQLYNSMKTSGNVVRSSIFPIMISAFGKAGDLRNAVASYDDYRDLAILNNSGETEIKRVDQEVYAALIRAYGESGSLDRGKKLLARIEADEHATDAGLRSRDYILNNGLLPFELQSGNFEGVYAIVNNLSPKSYVQALDKIAMTTADHGNFAESVKAFDALAHVQADLNSAASAIFALHIRTGQVEAGERFFRALQSASVTLETMQLSVLRAITFVSMGETLYGLQPARDMLVKYRSSVAAQTAGKQAATERIEEAIEAMTKAVFNGGHAPVSVEAAAEVLRMMSESGVVLTSYAEAILASLNADQIVHMAPADLDIFVQTQARLILDEASRDEAAPARFGCMLESVVARSALPDVSTENVIEKALVNLDRADLSRLWNNYRYPLTTGFSPSAQTPVSSNFAKFSPDTNLTTPSSFDDSFDPYLARTDHKGSVIITDILEKNAGRPAAVINEALTKFRNIRRAGRHPRFFAYAKLIQAAAKAGQLDRAQEVLEMAKQDIPYLHQYRIVRHGWVAILDSMVAACITMGKRDLASQYHQDLLDMGAAPSANTYGLYITSLKETTKTFDEASEAVKIFLRSRSEGVEPTSFLYNALIGKLGKARRIDDCLFYFAEMRNLGIRPTSVTYGTIVNALCRVSDEKFAEELFEEMESCTNYKPRPAPYHSLMQFFLTTKRDRSKVLAYYQRMRKQNIEPTVHTFKLLIDAYATIEPVDMPAAEAVLEQMVQFKLQPEAVHYASLIHAKGCVLHDMAGAQALFDKVVVDGKIRLQACLYQALFESMVANRKVVDAEATVQDMSSRGIEMTPYIVNALIHGWTLERDLAKATQAFNMVDLYHREPSTYEAMIRAHLAVEDREGAQAVVSEALSRGYPSAVAGKIAELVAGGRA
ncbi:hypothetical protein K461DRAFT_235717 [Myriangium duriaei CBS 260.36]|uniref:Tetratricopeptide repeat domain-containing protein n=1 Tax=Myriangium duriaei CBS 260.36 TaxID=1168546 RepID=A0A9P4MPP9_9PEZI|nr:hypothetical protein K461DRAFT_235717 [Myriangium duriaei CBS 260.36]